MDRNIIAALIVILLGVFCIVIMGYIAATDTTSIRSTYIETSSKQKVNTDNIQQDENESNYNYTYANTMLLLLLKH